MSLKSLLLIDDSPEDVQLILHALRGVLLPDQVAVSNSGEDALDYLFARGRHGQRDPRSTPRLILLDLILPRMSGLSVLRQIRENSATRLLPVAIISASIEQKDIRAAMQAGASTYIRKSLDYAKLNESVVLLARYWLDLNIAPPG